MIWDVVVVGGGHAGCEAALAAARMGRRTLLVTGRPETIASMPCNPSIGGPAKGQLVREIDALGGEMGRNTDRTQIQIRMLNTGNGPAVQAVRAQVDKALYAEAMQRALARLPNVHVRTGLVRRFLVGPASPAPCPQSGDAPDGRRQHAGPLVIAGVETDDGQRIHARSVVATTGTFLKGRLICGEEVVDGGRHGEPATSGLSAELEALGLRLGRLKTGTPPRVDARTIDFGETTPQAGSERPLAFSFAPVPESEMLSAPPNPVYPGVATHGWRTQMACYLVHTNERVHDVIRRNLHRAPMYNGTITAAGPRYCPSIEAKIVRFPEKERHQLYLEPEGFATNWVYVQGANTSLPEDVQRAILRSIPALANATLLRAGYAVEYDYVPPSQTRASLESKAVDGLFLAGQINGTSGYEEAAGQGLLAGVNAALRSRAVAAAVPQGESPGGSAAAPLSPAWTPLILTRAQAYIGVMVDDLTTTEIEEPYRLHTSRAEYRLLLRQDNADLRLTPLAYELGLVSRERLERTERKRDAVASALAALERTHLSCSDELNGRLAALGFPTIERSVTAIEYLRRPDVAYGFAAALGEDAYRGGVPDDVAEQIEIEAKYAGYVRKQSAEVARAERLEHLRIPASLDVWHVPGLRSEAREKLRRFAPATVGQASRIAGVTPADIAVLLVRLRA